MAERPPKNLRHFVYAREDVLQSLRGYSIIINEHEVPQAVRKDLYQAFSTDTPDASRMAAFRKIDPKPGENPFGEFFLFKKMPNHPEWVFGKGTVEHRGNETVGYYDSYVFHGVLLNREELLRLHCNPFFLAPLLSPFIGDNRSYKEPIPFPENMPPIGVARLEALKSLPLTGRLDLLNLASHLLKEAAFSGQNPPRAVPALLSTDAAFWSFFHLLLPEGIIFEKNLSVTSFRTFLNPPWRNDFFYGADLPSDEGARQVGREAGPFATLMFRELYRAEGQVADQPEDKGRTEFLSMVPAALGALGKFEKGGTAPRYETAMDAFDGALAAAARQGVSSLHDWPEGVSELFPYRIAHLRTVWLRNRPDFMLPGDGLSSGWAFRILHALDATVKLETACARTLKDHGLLEPLLGAFPYLLRAEKTAGFYDGYLNCIARLVNGRIDGRRLLARVINDPVWLVSPNTAALFSLLDNSRKNLFLRKFILNFSENGEKLLKFIANDGNFAPSLYLTAAAILETAERKKDHLLNKKVLQLFTTCTNVDYNYNGKKLMKETISKFPSLFGGLGPEWGRLVQAAGLSAPETAVRRAAPGTA